MTADGDPKVAGTAGRPRHGLAACGALYHHLNQLRPSSKARKTWCVAVRGRFASWDRYVLVLAYTSDPARPDSLLRQEYELTSNAGLFLELWWKGLFPNETTAAVKEQRAASSEQ